jgi:multiple sugar transport system permease protein
MVVDTIITNGNAAKNTVIYCFLAVLAALIVNPLCAYALSRYKMAPAYKILLFLMLPMAFPAMVLGIPQFLLIKDLGLLNTFAALILPGMANGYMIFLLKGFFDSLPKELFESAAIDGASEWTVFWHIAMGLSTPILSVLALNTFVAAYGNFMMAFLLCQDKSMWTMMVHLYQLQIRSSQAVGFAALIIAAIPTLLVFIFCQNIIIKGIVVPTEK